MHRKANTKPEATPHPPAACEVSKTSRSLADDNTHRWESGAEGRVACVSCPGCQAFPSGGAACPDSYVRFPYLFQGRQVILIFLVGSVDAGKVAPWGRILFTNVWRVPSRHIGM